MQYLKCINHTVNNSYGQNGFKIVLRIGTLEHLEYYNIMLVILNLIGMVVQVQTFKADAKYVGSRDAYIMIQSFRFE